MKDAQQTAKSRAVPKAGLGGKAAVNGKAMKGARAARPDKLTKPAARKRTPAAPVSGPDQQPLSIEACRKQIADTVQPARVARLADECANDGANAAHALELRQIAQEAHRVLEVQRAAGLSADIFEHPEGDAAMRDLVRNASRGDMDAAYRIAQAHKSGQLGTVQNRRRMEQWLRFAAELGNGRASWELAEYYNYGGLVADAARFERKAQDQGYRPPIRLPSRGY